MRLCAVTVCSAQASYRSAIRMARDVVQDIGAEAASASGGLVELSRISEHTSERDGERLISKKAGLSLGLPLTYLGEDELRFPILKLRDWAQFLCDRNCLHSLVGLQRPHPKGEADILSAFWNKFQCLFPDHQIFEVFRSKAADPTCTYPMVFHGDEGRWRRRQAFLVSNFHALLGKGTAEQVSSTTSHPYLRMRVNFLGSTHLTRMLHAAVPKKLLQNEACFDAVVQSAVDEAVYMIGPGVTQRQTGRRVWMATLHVCGDWAFLHKIGQLCRSFNNVPKKLSDPLRGICHRCQAGVQGVPWETIHEREPQWLNTVFSESAFTSIPAICRLLHSPGQEERILAFDLFHTMHLGVGKSFVGSCLVVLSQYFAGSSVDLRFKSLEAHFFNWCEVHAETPVIIRLTRETLQWFTAADFPQGNWFKGSVTTVFFRYLESVLSSGNWKHDPMLDKAYEAVVALNGCMKGLYCADLFVPPDEAKAIAENGLRFLRRMAWLSQRAKVNDQSLWLLTPKMHALHHLLLEDMLLPAQAGKAPMNPVGLSTQQDEDFIGKNSRVSRKVDPRTCSKRCIQRFMQASYAEYVKAGHILPR